MAFGAFGGRADLMERFDPRRADALPHAGTFNNNVLTMAAGLAALTQIYTPDGGREAERPRRPAARAAQRAAAERGLPFFATGYGSMVGLHFGTGPLRGGSRRRRDARRAARAAALALLEQGYSYARRGFVALSLPLADDDHDRFVQAVETFLDERGELVRLAA